MEWGLEKKEKNVIHNQNNSVILHLLEGYYALMRSNFCSFSSG